MKFSMSLFIGLCVSIILLVNSTGLMAGDADFILFNGKVITVDPEDRIVQAVAIQDGTILEVGSDQDILSLAGPQCRMIDLKGKTVTPGLIDSHYHLMYYGQQFWPDYLNIR